LLVDGNGDYPADKGNHVISDDDAEGGGTSRILEVLHFVQLLPSFLHSFDIKKLIFLVPTTAAVGDLSSLQQGIVDDGHRLQEPTAPIPVRLRVDPVRSSPELGDETAHETYILHSLLLLVVTCE
jgi:hypothetical protein